MLHNMNIRYHCYVYIFKFAASSCGGGKEKYISENPKSSMRKKLQDDTPQNEKIMFDKYLFTYVQ